MKAVLPIGTTTSDYSISTYYAKEMQGAEAPGIAQVSQGMVADAAAGETHQECCQSGQAFPVYGVPDGGGDRADAALSGNPWLHRPIESQPRGREGRMAGNGVKTWTGDEKSLVTVRRRIVKMLGFQRISVPWSRSGTCLDRVDSPT